MHIIIITHKYKYIYKNNDNCFIFCQLYMKSVSEIIKN